MQNLVLLILASVWAAVFLPPLLRSRIENRTSESVSDFRRQLNKLQSAVPNRGTGHMPMARPLAQSSLQRPAAGGRPGQPGRQHGNARRSSGGYRSAPRADRTAVYEPQGSGRYGRSHRAEGRRDPRAEQRPSRRAERAEPGRTPPRGRRRPADRRGGERRAPDRRPMRDDVAHRQTHVRRDSAQADLVRRRRSNVLIGLMVLTGVTLFVAAQSRSTAMLYAFSLSFIALCGFLVMLSQANKREAHQWGSDWMS